MPFGDDGMVKGWPGGVFDVGMKPIADDHLHDLPRMRRVSIVVGSSSPAAQRADFCVVERESFNADSFKIDCTKTEVEKYSTMRQKLKTMEDSLEEEMGIPISSTWMILIMIWNTLAAFVPATFG
uniref:Transmembrane protein n=1 Tax=Steinernema glaseri TaxID=37863 RepID=A0A1I8AKW2_9BILA